MEVQRQLVARTPVLYRLEQIDNGTASVGYMRLKEFNALARKDLVIGSCSSNQAILIQKYIIYCIFVGCINLLSLNNRKLLRN